MRWRVLAAVMVVVGIGSGLSVGETTKPPPKNMGPVKTPPATRAAASAPAVPAPVPLETGYRTNQDLPGAAGQTYEIYVPQGEAKAGMRRPVVFVLGRSSSLNTKWINAMGLPGWAEENGAVVIGVNELFVATPPATTAPAVGKALPTEEAMDAYMALADSLGLHPTVRLVVCDDAALTGQLRVLAVGQRYPGKVAGVVMGPRLYEPYKDAPAVKLGAGTGVAIVSVTWEAYAKSHAAKPYVIGTDDVYGNEKFEGTIGAALRSAKVPVCYVETDDFVNVKADKMRAALSWLLEEAWLGKAGTTKEEVAAAKEAVKAELKKAADESDVAVREAKLRDLLMLPGEVDGDGKAHLTTWRKAVLEAADTRTELLFKDLYMKKMAALPMMAGSPEAKLLGAKIAALESDAKGKKEIDGEKKVRELALKVGELGVDQKTLEEAKKLQADFVQVTVDFADTLAAREAKDWADLLERRIKNTAARPIRSKGH